MTTPQIPHREDGTLTNADWDAIDQAGWESFPASDPPAGTPGEPRPTSATVREDVPNHRWAARIAVGALLAGGGLVLWALQHRRTRA